MSRQRSGLVWYMIGAICLVCCGACALPDAPVVDPAQAEAAARREAAREEERLVPAGRGSLRQDEFTVSIRSGPLLIKITPLDESIIRLAAPDTYERLRSLAASRQEELARSLPVAVSECFLVSFFSYEPDVLYEPSYIRIEQRGTVFQPASILPITPGWGRQRLDRQQTQMAIYTFRAGLDLWMPFMVYYDLEESDQWSRVIPRLETERARIVSDSL